MKSNYLGISKWYYTPVDVGLKAIAIDWFYFQDLLFEKQVIMSNLPPMHHDTTCYIYSFYLPFTTPL